MNKGKVVVISGPSGVGKHTIFEKILKYPDLNLTFSVSMTTRKKRPNEEEGKDYFFVSEEMFNKSIENNEFIEWAEFCGNKYGTPKQNLIDCIESGKNIALEIETVGANNIFKIIPNHQLISIFILPPTINELEERLKRRGSESQEVISKRVQKAKEELMEKHKYQFNVVNDDLDRCVKEIYKIIKSNIY